MSLNLLEVVRAAQLGEATLSAETAGYLVLATADQLCRMGRRVEAHAISIQETGELSMGEGVPSNPAELELSLRLLLGRLLRLCRATHSGLHEVSLRRGSTATLVSELEAALIPVNRAAARRAIARLHRETDRARKKGLLNDLVTAHSVFEEAATERAAFGEEPTSRRSRPAVVVASSSDAGVPFTGRKQPSSATMEWLDESRRSSDPIEYEEQTVRLDQLRLNLHVAMKTALDEMSSAKEAADAASKIGIDPLKATLALLPTDETPFLGSVAAVVQAEPPIALDPEPPITAEPATLPINFAKDEAKSEPGWDEIVAEHASIPPAPPEAASAFSLDLDQAPGELASVGVEEPRAELGMLPISANEEIVVGAEAQEDAGGESLDADGAADESDTASADETEEAEVEPSRFYTPRKSDLSELLQGLAEHSETDPDDIARQLKQLAGIEAKTNPLRQGLPRSALVRGKLVGKARRSRASFFPKALE